MFVAPFIRLCPQAETASSRLGAGEAARQAALLRLPDREVRHEAIALPIARRFHDSIRREGWKDGGH